MALFSNTVHIMRCIGRQYSGSRSAVRCNMRLGLTTSCGDRG